MPRRIDVSEEELRHMHASGLTMAAMAEGLHIGLDALRLRMHELGLRPNLRQPLRLTPEQGEHAATMYRQGWGTGRIALALGVKQSAVGNEIAARGIERSVTRQRAVADNPPQRQPVQTIDTSTLTGQLIATKGRWADLSKIGVRHGWSSARTQQEYHKARAAQ